MKIGVIADDFTGATDIAGFLVAGGLTTTQMIGVPDADAQVDADAVVISDFIAQRLPDEVINKVGELQHKHQHRFHAVAMSVHGKPGIMRVFDHIWRFDTGLRSRLLRRWRR